MSTKLNPGDRGGECVAYAGMTYFGKRFGVLLAKDAYYASTVTQLSGPESGCVACWGNGDGHVGVVEYWDSRNKTMTFSDSNRARDGLVQRDYNMTEEDMKAITSGFQGYVKFK